MRQNTTPSSNKGKEDAQERAKEPVNNPGQNERENASRRALGNQTELGDQTELNVGGDQPTAEPEERGQEHKEELAHSNSSTDHHSFKTKAGERDLGGRQGGW